MLGLRGSRPGTSIQALVRSAASGTYKGRPFPQQLESQTLQHHLPDLPRPLDLSQICSSRLPFSWQLILAHQGGLSPATGKRLC